MNVRKIFVEPQIGTITQGTIFNCAIAEDYSEDVYGIIITPRCDITNGKVNMYHYLPVIKFNEWVKVDFWFIFSLQLQTIIKNQISNILLRYKISPTLIDKFAPSLIKEKILSKITKQKDSEKLSTALEELETLQRESLKIPSNDTFRYFISHYEKNAKSIFKELKEHKRKGYYLLESWEANSDNFYVVLLREIKTISVKAGEKLGNGFLLTQLTEKELSKNDFRKKRSEDDMVYPIKTMTSPYIEHLIQVFFQNFGRIGVNDHHRELETHLVNLCK